MIYETFFKIFIIAVIIRFFLWLYTRNKKDISIQVDDCENCPFLIKKELIDRSDFGFSCKLKQIIGDKDANDTFTPIGYLNKHCPSKNGKPEITVK